MGYLFGKRENEAQIVILTKKLGKSKWILHVGSRGGKPHYKENEMENKLAYVRFR